MKKNKFLFLAAPLITLLMLFAFSTCSGGEFSDPGYLAAPDFARSGSGDKEGDYSGGSSGGGNSGGNSGGGSFSSLIGNWEKSTGQTLKAFIDSSPTRNILQFFRSNASQSGYGDLYFTVTSYNGSTANLRCNYEKVDSTITITVSGTSLTVNGFTSPDTQYNGTYTKK